MKKIIILITAILSITGITYGANTPCQSDSDCHVGCCINYECKLSFDCDAGGGGGGGSSSGGNNGGGGYGGNGSNGTAAANGVTTNTGSSGSNPSTNTGYSNQTNDECTKDSDCSGGGICQQDGDKKVCIRNDYGDLGININKDCLLNGQCSMNIYETIGIRQSNPDPDVKTFAQDIILGATMFFGTVMTVLFIVSGLSYVMAGFNGKSPDKAKKMMVGSIVGLLFVTFSYTIIRLIQFLATGGS